MRAALCDVKTVYYILVITLILQVRHGLEFMLADIFKVIISILL